MFPFIYYVDCEGNLWVPCNCRCNGNGNGYDNGNGYGRVEIVYANGRRERLPEGRDSCVKRDFECIRPASESEKTALKREQDFEKLLNDALEAIGRLERLHAKDLVLAPGA